MMNERKRLEYSVLMPLWYQEKETYLRASLESMLAQTRPPKEIVLAADYEIPDRLTEVMRELGEQYRDSAIRLACNPDLAGRGLGAVLRFGVTECRCEIVARMDTDDIAKPERCERELEILEQHPEIAIVGGGVVKFSGAVDKVEGYRIPPEQGKKLLDYSKYRSPFTHPTVMFRREAVLAAGNYRELKQCEDYDLWYRLFRQGYRGYNLQSPVLYYRAGEEMVRRRKDKSFYEGCKKLIKDMEESRYLTRSEVLAARAFQFLRFHCPAFLAGKLYQAIKW